MTLHASSFDRMAVRHDVTTTVATLRQHLPPDDHRLTFAHAYEQCLSKFQNLEPAHRAFVLETLLKELSRCQLGANEDATALETLSIEALAITLLLSGVGSLAELSEPLWALIKAPELPDAVKGFIQLSLIELGDPAAPQDYFNYFSNAEAHVQDETTTMLAGCQHNPEVLMDCLDFILALPLSDQQAMLQGFIQEQSPQQLAVILMHYLDAQPGLPLDMIKPLLDNLASSRSVRTLHWLADLLAGHQQVFDKTAQWPPHHSAYEHAHRKLLLACGQQQAQKPLHPLCVKAPQAQAFASFPDANGNQAFLVGRHYPPLTAAAIFLSNDTLGTLDGFGFVALESAEWEKLRLKFEADEGLAVAVPLPVAAHAIKHAAQFARMVQNPIGQSVGPWLCLLEHTERAPEEPAESQGHDDATALSGEPPAVSAEALFALPELNRWYLAEDFLALFPKPPITPELLPSVLETGWHKIFAQRLQHVAQLSGLRAKNSNAKIFQQWAACLLLEASGDAVANHCDFWTVLLQRSFNKR